MVIIENRPIFFIHVPKTAGSTLRSLIEKKFKPHQICPDWMMMARFNNHYPPENWYLRLSDEEFQQFQLLRGHMHYSLYQRFDHRPVIVTMLREPVARTISHIRHVLRAENGNQPPENEAELVEQMALNNTDHVFSNYQTQFFAGDFTIEDFTNPEGRVQPNRDIPITNIHLEQAIRRLEKIDIIGIQSRFDDSLKLLCKKLGWPEPEEVTRLNEARGANIELSEEALESIKLRTSFDAKLYAYAEELFEKQFTKTFEMPVKSQAGINSMLSGENGIMKRPADRKEQILYSCDTDGKGLEIGPSYNPVAPKKKGYNIEVLDHASADGLREKYGSNPRVDISNIEEVDYIWTGEPLDETTQKSDYYDYIIASHVIEHTPDVVAFLSQCENMLKPGGVLALAVPDKRFCFDYFRPVSSTGDALQAHYEKRKFHTPGTIFDHFSSSSERNGNGCWPKKGDGKLAFIHNVNVANDMMQKAMKQDEYIDAHNWRFTPTSFRLIVSDLAELSLIGMTEYSKFDSPGCEFIISLKKGGAPARIDRLELAKAIANGK